MLFVPLTTSFKLCHAIANAMGDVKNADARTGPPKTRWTKVGM
ncbi:MAG: hypothetical protein QMD22_05245 [archaeon]|nr:hypothetical protein [archaeon]